MRSFKFPSIFWRCLVLGFTMPVMAQTRANDSATIRAAAVSAIPQLVNYSGVLKDASGRTLTGITGVSFLIYKEQTGGAPLWLETQSVNPDKSGHYTVQLGTASQHGLPADVFANGEGRWLAVQIANEAEQPRVMLVAVPYALKAADAETIGGLPPSAFVLAAPAASVASASTSTASSGSPSITPAASSNVTTTGGAVNAIPLFTTATNIQNSIVTQTGATAVNVAGKLNLPASGTATAAAGKNSRPEDFVASSFNSGTAAAVAQTFQLQAEPAGNNTATPSGTLNLLYGSGATAPAETGFKLSSKGVITFAPGQTFPGTGPGTVTSVGLSAPQSDFTVGGSPVTGAGTLGVAWKVAPTNANTANAIVKRDVTGSFNVTGINGTGTFSTITGNSTAIVGSTSLNGGVAIKGTATSPTSGTGVFGESASTGTLSSGVTGVDNGGSGLTLGVGGVSVSPGGIGVLGFNGTNGLSQFFNQAAGAQRVGIWGDAQAGSNELEGVGVVGTSDTGIAVLAENGPGAGFAAIVAQGGNALSGGANNGAPGISASGGANSCCDSGSDAGKGGPGIVAQGGSGIEGNLFGGPGPGGSFTGGGSDCAGIGCGGDGIFAQPGSTSTSLFDGFAGNFNGDIEVSGTIFAGTKDFKIDHPSDPANKYLLHTSVESSEMMNIYSGNVTTDAGGDAVVQLPAWFQAENTDFRYQLTVIGQFAQAIVASEIADNQFSIKTDKPKVKVSWQVTSIRQDAYAKAHPLTVEQVKDARERGYYIHPELYGAPEEKQIEWARHPQLMRQSKEARLKQLAGLQRGQQAPTASGVKAHRQF